MARKLKAALAKYQAEQKVAHHKASKERHAEKIKLDQSAAKAVRTKAAQANFSSGLVPWLPFEDNPDDTVLFVGEGDFSFSLNFIDKFPNINIIATSLDSRDEVVSKYGPPAEETLKELEELEAVIFHAVDVTQLSKHKQLTPQYLKQNKSLTVVFNFPHLGNSVSNQDRNIRQHQELLLSFFKECKAIGAKNVVIALFDGEPYNSWQPKQLARSAGYQLVRSGRFPWQSFPEYRHQLTAKGGGQTSKSQKQRNARIYLWSLAV